MRNLLALLGTLVLALSASAAAEARIIEIGHVEGDAPVPSCPEGPCYVMARTTGYQAQIEEHHNPFIASEDGVLVAWSIGLSTPTEKQISIFDKNFESSSAAIAVLDPVRKRVKKGRHKFLRTEKEAKLLGQSSVQKLAPFFGQTVQFPLDQPLPVKKGNLIALTVPTWAPTLAVGLGDQTSWRSSREQDKCPDTDTQSVQSEKGTEAPYSCSYQTARLMYSATMITKPKPTAESTSKGEKKGAKRRRGKGSCPMVCPSV